MTHDYTIKADTQSIQQRFVLSLTEVIKITVPQTLTTSTHEHIQSPHAVSSAQCLSAEAGCDSDPDLLSHVALVYPKTMAVDRSCCVSAAQALSAETGCCSLPDSLSHDTWVYPKIPAATCSLLQPERNRFTAYFK